MYGVLVVGCVQYCLRYVHHVGVAEMLFLFLNDPATTEIYTE